MPPKEQTLAMADRLKSAGKDVTVVQLPGDDHYLHSSASRITMLEAMDAFLAKHLPANLSGEPDPDRAGSIQEHAR